MDYLKLVTFMAETVMHRKRDRTEHVHQGVMFTLLLIWAGTNKLITMTELAHHHLQAHVFVAVLSFILEVLTFVLVSYNFTSCLHIVPPVWWHALPWCDSPVSGCLSCVFSFCLHSLHSVFVNRLFVFHLLFTFSLSDPSLNWFSIVCQVIGLNVVGP